jgi:hypothetical protein
MIRPLIDPIKDRGPVLFFWKAWGCYIQADDKSPWGGLNIYQADSTVKGTYFNRCDTAKTYEFTGIIAPFGMITELILITTPVPIILISSQNK